TGAIRRQPSAGNNPRVAACSDPPRTDRPATTTNGAPISAMGGPWWLRQPARDAISHLRGARDNPLDPSADEGKKRVRYTTCFARTDRTETDRTEPKCLIAQEAAPALRGRMAPSRHVPGHSGLRDIESQLQQVTMGPGGSP